MSAKLPSIPIPYPDKPGFSYDPTPMTHAFPGQPEDCFDLVNQYGTYNIQRTADTENFFPAIAQGLPKDAHIPNRPETESKKQHLD